MHFATDFLTNLLSANAGKLSFFQILGAAAFAYVGGILSSLTPCVYPMIPITVGVIGGRIGGSTAHARTQEQSWHEVFLRCGAYIFGMAVVYSFLGVLAGITGKVFG